MSSRYEQKREDSSLRIKHKYVPDSTELRAIIDQYIVERTNTDDTTTTAHSPSSESVDPTHIQAYIMEKNPTWSVPEKRRLQKFVKRATLKQSPSSQSPSTPVSLGDADADNEIDNRSERSRSSRFKGITSRLFGNGNSKSNAKAVAFEPPIQEIQANTEMMTNSTQESIQESNDPLLSGQIEAEYDKNVVLEEKSIIVEAQSIEYDAKNETSTTATAIKLTEGTIDESSIIYKDDNDGTTITKRNRCWCLFC